MEYSGPTTLWRGMTGKQSTAVLEVSGVQWASEEAEAVLSRRPGVLGVEPIPVAQTATVTYDPDQTSVAELAGWVRIAVTTVPASRFPSTSAIPWPSPAHAAKHDHLQAGHQTLADDHHAGHQHVITKRRRQTTLSVPHADHAADAHDTSERDGPRRASRWHVHGRHGARHAEPIPGRRPALHPDLAGSPIGRDVIGFSVPAPFGLRDDVFSLIFEPAGDLLLGLDLLRRRLAGAAGAHLDMMVLVAVAIAPVGSTAFTSR